MISDVITRTHGKDRVIDFRDGLEPAQPEQYAAMHQVGGKKNGKNYPSVIKIFLCDFSGGTGERSITVSANIEPTLCYEWLEVCKMNLGCVVVPYYEKGQSKGGTSGRGDLTANQFKKIRDEISAANCMAGSFSLVLKSIIFWLKDLVLGRLPQGSRESYMGLGSRLKTVMERETQIVEYQQGKKETALTLARGIDYTYVQDKVNVYRQGQEGYAPVSRLLVSRKSFRSDGDAATYPWTVKITTGEALVVEKEDGATTYRADTMRNRQEAYIYLSDRDFFRMMVRITRYIEIWEDAFCIPVINNGINQKIIERNQLNNQQ